MYSDRTQLPQSPTAVGSFYETEYEICAGLGQFTVYVFISTTFSSYFEQLLVYIIKRGGNDVVIGFCFINMFFL